MNKSYNPLTIGSVLKQVGRYNAPHTRLQVTNG